MRGKKAQIIMFAGAKGGTGKTSICALVGAALSKKNLRVLCIELGSGPRTLDLISGTNGNIVYDLSDVFNMQCPLQKAVVKSELYNNLYVLCAPKDECYVEPQIFIKMINDIALLFDFILIDVQSGIGVPFYAAKVVAHKAILVLTPDKLAIRGGQVIKNALSEDTDIDVKLIINKVDNEVFSGGIEDLDEMIDETQTALLGVVPSCEHIKKSANTGESLPENLISSQVFDAISKRLCGEEIPLVFKDIDG